MTSRLFTAAAATAALLATTACISDPNTGEQRVSRAAIGAGAGAIGGYLLGDLIGGRRDRTERIIGTGVGALAGGAIGAYMDRQEQELRRRTAGTGIEVERQGDELVLHLPAAVTFAVNRYDIQPQFRATLDDVARTLADYPQTLVDVYGHTDPSGGDAINVPLSQNRARAVADYLALRGVNQARIASQGFGSSRPLPGNMNRTEAERQENRRVEIRVVPLAA